MKRFFSAVLLVFLAASAYTQDKINQVDAQGRKQGTWIKKYPNDQVRYQGQFENDKPVGTFFYYFEEGGKSSEVTYTGTDGVAGAKFFHKNGTVMGEGQYLNQQKHGEWRFYDDKTMLSAIEHYENGKQHGTSTIFYLNGKPSAVFQYVQGVKTGPFREYFSDGAVKIEGTYLDDNFDGEYKQYYGEGKLMIQGQYRAAVKDGHWIYYTDDGRIQAQQVYNKGKLEKEKFEEGFNSLPIPVELKEEEKLDENELMEQYYKEMNGGG